MLRGKIWTKYFIKMLNFPRLFFCFIFKQCVFWHVEWLNHMLWLINWVIKWVNEWKNELIHGNKRNGWRDELSDYIDWAGCFYGVSIFVTSWRVTLMQVKIFVHTSLNFYTWLMLKSQILHCWYVLCEQL